MRYRLMARMLAGTAVLLLTGCANIPRIIPRAPAPPPTPPSPAQPRQTDEDSLVIEREELPPDSPWTKEPTLDDIPDQPLRGELGDRPFVLKFARGQMLREDLLSLQLSTAEPEDPNDPGSAIWHAQVIQLWLPLEEGTTGEIDLEPLGTIVGGDAPGMNWLDIHEPGGTTITASTFAFAVMQIDEWIVNDPPKGAHAGTVKGRLKISFNDEHWSHVAGTFEAHILPPPPAEDHAP